MSQPPEIPATIIDLVNVSTGFPGRSVLAGITLRVNRGDLVLIEGSTGAGKTTLVRLLLGALPVQSGVARVLGADLARASQSTITDLRRRIGMVFQLPRFLDQASVLTNVSLPLAILGESASHCRAEGTRMLMDANLASATRKRPHQLSGGEQARLQIARALIHQPYLVMADEPFAHLDPDSAAEAEALLEAAHARGMTILITSHRPTKLAERARRLRIEKGGLV
jgi:cell division transport system ATP-binding protein